MDRYTQTKYLVIFTAILALLGLSRIPAIQAAGTPNNTNTNTNTNTSSSTQTNRCAQCPDTQKPTAAWYYKKYKPEESFEMGLRIWDNCGIKKVKIYTIIDEFTVGNVAGPLPREEWLFPVHEDTTFLDSGDQQGCKISSTTMYRTTYSEPDAIDPDDPLGGVVNKWIYVDLEDCNGNKKYYRFHIQYSPPEEWDPVTFYVVDAVQSSDTPFYE